MYRIGRMHARNVVYFLTCFHTAVKFMASNHIGTSEKPRASASRRKSASQMRRLGNPLRSHKYKYTYRLRSRFVFRLSTASLKPQGACSLNIWG